MVYGGTVVNSKSILWGGGRGRGEEGLYAVIYGDWLSLGIFYGIDSTLTLTPQPPPSPTPCLECQKSDNPMQCTQGNRAQSKAKQKYLQHIICKTNKILLKNDRY